MFISTSQWCFITVSMPIFNDLGLFSTWSHCIVGYLDVEIVQIWGQNRFSRVIKHTCTDFWSNVTIFLDFISIFANFVLFCAWSHCIVGHLDVEIILIWGQNRFSRIVKHTCTDFWSNITIFLYFISIFHNLGLFHSWSHCIVQYANLKIFKIWGHNRFSRPKNFTSTSFYLETSIFWNFMDIYVNFHNGMSATQSKMADLMSEGSIIGVWICLNMFDQ